MESFVFASHVNKFVSPDLCNCLKIASAWLGMLKREINIANSKKFPMLAYLPWV